MKTLKILMLAAATGAIGCGSLDVDQSKTVPAPPRADEATQDIYAAFAMHSMPTVYWYGGAALNCSSGNGYLDQTGTCVGGDQEDGVIIVADVDGYPIHDLGLAHEMAHEASDQHGEGGCADHRCHWFTPGGDVDRENQVLASLGM